MHKLKVSIRNDAHKFYLRENNYKDFEIFAYDASAIYDILLEYIRQQSTVSIGDKDVCVVARCLPYASAYTTSSSLRAITTIWGIASSNYSYAMSLVSGLNYRVVADKIMTSSEVGVKSGIALRFCNDVNTYTSSIYMGNKDIALCEFDGLLKELPDELRQFGGRYVYVFAKCNPYPNAYDVSTSVKFDAFIRAITTSTYVCSTSLASMLSCRLITYEMMASSKVGIKCGIAVRAYNDANTYESITSYNAKIAYKARMDKCGYVTVFNCNNHMLGRLLASESNIASKIDINDSKIYLYGVNRLSSFNGKLNELPQSLFDFCYKAV